MPLIYINASHSFHYPCRKQWCKDKQMTHLKRFYIVTYEQINLNYFCLMQGLEKNLPFRGVERESHGVLNLFKSPPEAAKFVLRPLRVVDKAQLRRLNVAEDGNNLLVAPEKKRELMEAKVRFGVAWRQKRHSDLALHNSPVDFIKQFVPGFHGLVIQERVETVPLQMVIHQRCHRLLGVHAPVVQEHVTRLHHPPHHFLCSLWLTQNPAQAHCHVTLHA